MYLQRSHIPAILLRRLRQSIRLYPVMHSRNLITALALAGGLTISSTLSNAQLDLRLPELGNPSRAVISEREEHAIGESFYRRLREKRLIETDPLIHGYIEDLGNRLLEAARANPDEFTFFVVNDMSVNAFAAPGGFIGVNKGLILTMQNEAELAAVLAHEIAHVTQRHLVRHFEATSGMSLGMAAAILAAILIGKGNGEAGEALIYGSLGASARESVNFTRSHEQEADRVGIQFLQEAGYPGLAMADTFRRLQELSRFGGDGIPEFLRSHPVNESRIAEAHSRVRATKGTPFATSQENTRFEITRVLIENSRYPATPERMEQLRTAIRDGRVRDKRTAQLALALALQKSGNNTEATSIVKSLIKKDNNRVVYHLTLAKLLETQNQNEAALTTLQIADELFPNNIALQQSIGQLLRILGRHTESYAIFRNISQSHPSNPEIRTQLAQIAFSLGRRDEAQLETAEAHLLNGRNELAKIALDKAAKAPSSNDVVAERIAERLHELASKHSGRRVTSKPDEKARASH